MICNKCRRNVCESCNKCDCAPRDSIIKEMQIIEDRESECLQLSNRLSALLVSIQKVCTETEREKIRKKFHDISKETLAV